jgi:type VI secretion system secreted protein VgrG
MTVPNFSQTNRPLRATTPLGGSVLVPVSYIGEEEVSKPFLYTADFVSTNASIAASAMLGKPVTLHVTLGNGKVRDINGLVRRFSNLGGRGLLTLYRAEIVPALWFLTLSSDCRTFEDKSLLDIVEKVCKDAGVTDIKQRVQSPPSPIPYVVQYRETDFAFVSRLLEEAGFYYTFEHTASAHTLVFSDSFGGSIPAGALPSLKISSNVSGGQFEVDSVRVTSRDFAVHSATSSVMDHDLLRAANIGSSDSVSAGARGVAFDFLGDIPPRESAIESVRRIEILESAFDQLHGESNSASLQAGTRVRFTGAPFGAGGAEFHVLQVKHKAEGGDVVAGSSQAFNVTNTFTAVPVATFLRMPRSTPLPSVRGTHTAKIVGAGGDAQIDVDADGRVLLEFPWDRGDGAQGKSKHRVHVASVWAGAAWGFVQLPRVGQEVLVEYLEGDPARPIVTGRVYNSTHKPPYTLPANKTQSGWKSRTLGGTAENFNELRFEDKKGEEQVFLQAEKNLQVKVKVDETWTTGNDRTETIQRHHKQTLTEGDQTVLVTKGKQHILVKEGEQMLAVAEGPQVLWAQNGKQTFRVDKEDQEIIVTDGDRTAVIKAGSDSLEVSQGHLETVVKTGNIKMTASLGTITLEAMNKITLKVGSNSIEISTTGITIKGMQVSVDAQTQAEVKGVKVSGMVQVKAPMTQVSGDATLILKGGVTMIN